MLGWRCFRLPRVRKALVGSTGFVLQSPSSLYFDCHFSSSISPSRDRVGEVGISILAAKQGGWGLVTTAPLLRIRSGTKRTVVKKRYRKGRYGGLHQTSWTALKYLAFLACLANNVLRPPHEHPSAGVNTFSLQR